MLMGGGRSSRHPFTASQWQELEHQALIFKYMMSGLPVPPELILPIRRNLFMDSVTLPFFPHPHPTPIGWAAHQMGYARKAEDPEPGRCRRTDGKKWRCSKEAYPDSKYCERHMHRGKSRSRKLVELSLATNSASAHEFPSKDLPPPLSLSVPDTQNPLMFPCSSSPRFHPAGYPHQDVPATFCPPSVPHSVDTYGNFLGFKEDINEFPFFSETTGDARETTCSRPKGGFDQDQLDGSCFRNVLPEKKGRRCFVLGSDLRQQKDVAGLEREEERQKVRPFHCFFDELPQRSKVSWMDRAQHDSFSTTQLSISIPAANHEMPVRASRCFDAPNVAT